MSLSQFTGEYKYSKIQVENPDPREFPLYYKARKHVFEIGPGEALFIPAGWFHFVFSTADTTDGLNFAVNYWYFPVDNWDRGKRSNLLPYTLKHELNIEPIELVPDHTMVKCARSTLNGLFPPDRLSHIFKGYVTFENMTLKELLQTKNPRYYAAQIPFDNNKYKGPKYCTDLYMNSGWINFGNATSLCHFDEHDNFLCQLKGRKRVVMFPHEDRDLLYMFNPIHMNLIKEIMKGQFIIGSLTQVINKEYDEKFDPRDLYKQTLEHYINVVGQCPTFELPTSFKTIDTKGKVYLFEKFDLKYPLRMIWIISGRGEFHTFETKKLIGPGDVIMVPTGIPFFWKLTGNLKFITHE
jgi:mannose-6-phosphate isomerase-like protein (cupin superfamily)